MLQLNVSLYVHHWQSVNLFGDITFRARNFHKEVFDDQMIALHWLLGYGIGSGVVYNQRSLCPLKGMLFPVSGHLQLGAARMEGNVITDLKGVCGMVSAI